MIANLLLYIYILHITIFWSYSLGWAIYHQGRFNQRESKKIAQYALKVQITILPLCGVVFYHFYKNFDTDYILSFPKFSLSEFKKCIFMILYVDVWFYHIHRLFHIPSMYKIHKKHHRYIAPVPWEALFATYTENIILNFFPVFSAPLFCYLNIHYLFLWVAIATFQSVHSHGFNTKHSIHHKNLKVNFGITRIFDSLYGTNMT